MRANIGKKAIIIGGGIGGVTAALALQQAGMEVTVFERAEELREVGSGLPLWTNALRALGKLGLSSAVEALGESFTSGLCLTTWDGKVLADLRTHELLERLGTVNEVVHRAELLAVLVAALGEERVQLNSTCVGFTQDATGVWARFAGGREAFGDLLIGADGLHSVIRAQMFGLKKPKYAGYTCWRGVASIDRPDLATWAWGKSNQIGIASMGRGRVYWFVQRPAPEGQPEKPCGRKREVLEVLHDWHDPIPAVIEATDEAHILRNDIYRAEPLRHWSRGRVTLLGDAAHAMTPDLGQGACQAIEDAVVLADCLRTESSIPAAFRLYEKRRVARANRVAFLAQLAGKSVHMRNQPLSRLRDSIVQVTPIHLMVQRAMWLLDYNP